MKTSACVLSVIIVVLMLTMVMATGCISDYQNSQTGDTAKASSVSVPVADQKLGITISPNSPVTTVGSAIRFIVVYDNGYSPNSVEWSVVGPASIDSSGRFQAENPGSAVVTAVVGQASISTTVIIDSVVHYHYSDYSGSYCDYNDCYSYNYHYQSEDYYNNYNNQYGQYGNGGAVERGIDEGNCIFLGKC